MPKRKTLTEADLTSKFWLDQDGNLSDDLDPTRLTSYVLGLMNDKIKAQNARDAAAEEKQTAEDRIAELEDAGADAAKVDDRIKDLQKENRELKKNAEKPSEREQRLEVAIEKGLTVKQAERLRGNSLDELLADADEYLAEVGGSKKDGESGEEDGGSSEPKAPPTRRPQQMNNGFKSGEPAIEDKIPEINWI